MPKTHCFMMAPRSLTSAASVAAVTIRKRHPGWIFWLVTTDGCVAPWRNTMRAAFDAVVSEQALAAQTTGAVASGPDRDPMVHRIGSAFRGMFHHGADVAVLANPHHVWFADLPIDAESTEVARFVRASDGFEQLQPDDWASVPLLGLERRTDVDQAIAEADILARSDSRTKCAPSDVIGLRATGMHGRPLRFDPDGQLRWGSQVVRSIDFSALPPAGGTRRPVVDTTWLELQHWYQQQLGRFG